MVFRQGIDIFSKSGSLGIRGLQDLAEKTKILDMDTVRKELDEAI